MTLKAAGTLAVVAGFAFVGSMLAGSALAQDLGPQIKKLSDGVYVYVGKNFNSNSGIVLTQDGVVLIDTGHNPTDSRAILDAVKKLTPMPVRLLIDTEPHPDHTTGHFVFSPPAVDRRGGGRRRVDARPRARGPAAHPEARRHLARDEGRARGL